MSDPFGPSAGSGYGSAFEVHWARGSTTGAMHAFGGWDRQTRLKRVANMMKEAGRLGITVRLFREAGGRGLEVKCDRKTMKFHQRRMDGPLELWEYLADAIESGIERFKL